MNTDDVGSVRPHPPTLLSMHISSPSTRTYKQILNKYKTRDSIQIDHQPDATFFSLLS